MVDVNLRDAVAENSQHVLDLVNEKGTWKAIFI